MKKNILLGIVANAYLTFSCLAQVPTSGLVGYYPFTGNANDLSGGGQNGTVYGATLTFDRFGNANSAYLFNGSSNYISVPPTNYFNNQYTYSYWMKVVAYPPGSAGAYAFSFGTTSPITEGVNSGLHNTNMDIDIGSLGTNSIGVVVSAATAPVINQWYHVVGTRNSSFLKLYINGIMVDSGATNGSNPQYGSGPFTFNIGCRNNVTYFFNGVLDDFRMYSRVLSASEIQSLYNEITGIEAIENKNGFIIYPNPYSLQATIKFPNEQENITIKITDILGKEIKKISFTGREYLIEKGDMKEGVYFIHVIDQQSRVLGVKKIVLL